MRDTRVYVAAPLAQGRTLDLPAQAAQHLTRVLRLRDGTSITAFNGSGGEYRSTLRLPGRGAAQIEVHEFLAIERESPLRITLLQALARGEKMDWVIQKATELGVTAIVPVATERAVVQLDAERSDKRVQHWQAIAAAACEQCGRNTLPRIEVPRELDEALPGVAALRQRLVLDPRGALPLPSAVDLQDAAEVAVLVGPEGGFAEAELELAVRAGFKAIRLGPRVLRTETAGLAALAALQCLAGDFA